jgi:hypothetical protein
MLIVTNPEAVPGRYGGQLGDDKTGNAKRCVAHRILKIGWGYVKQVEIVSDDRLSSGERLRAEWKAGVDKGPVSIGEM